MQGLSIAITGCGIAGLTSALLLARDGHRVTLFERFAEPRPLGSGLMIQPTGLAVLDQLGLGDDLIRRGAQIDRLFGQASGRTILNVHYDALGRPGTFGIGIHRASLFGLLYDAVKAAGIAVQTGHDIVASTVDGERRRLHFADGARSQPFDLIVDALGTHSPLAPRTGKPLAYGALWCSLDWPDELVLDPHWLSQRYRQARIMAGVLPTGIAEAGGRPQASLFWSLRDDALGAWRAQGLAAWKEQILALWPDLAPLVTQVHDADQMTFARYAHRTVHSPVSKALIHIGDAWHSASPQLGQGANMALLDAYALSLALRHNVGLEEVLTNAISLRRRHIHLYQALTATFTPVYQSDGRFVPWLRDWLVGPLSQIGPAPKIQAALVSGLVGNPLKPLGLTLRH